MSGVRPPTGLPTHLRLVEPLGAGTSSTVWRARDTRRGRDVAVKVVEPAVTPDTSDQGRAAAAEQLEREVRALARLADVPGVLQLHECGTTGDGTTWLVTPLLTRGSLEDRAGTGSVELDDAIELAAALADTLAEAHARGVVHGDVTPSNVLFGPQGEPLLADFGLARLDGLGGRGCTPAYAAPERLRGAPASAAGDVWSVAATVLTATLGRDGWHGEEVPAVLRECLSERPSTRPDAAELARRLRARRPRASLRRGARPHGRTSRGR